MKSDSPEYLKKKKNFESILTIYGRNPVVEALQTDLLQIKKVHLAISNQKNDTIQRIHDYCEKRNIPIATHTREELSRISKNGKQDQGVAADIRCPKFKNYEELYTEPLTYNKLIALDQIQTPENLGMIIRSACAGFIDGLLLPKKGCASLSPLVIKASTGTIFRTSIYRCETLLPTLKDLQTKKFTLAALDASAPISLFQYHTTKPTIFILGNESTGVSKEILSLCDQRLSIPMNNQVESLNVAITAALIAFQNPIQK